MTTDTALRWLGGVPLFDPSQGSTVIASPGQGPGWWVGAPSALYDRESGLTYLYYRVRKPRALGRGGECRIAASRDGLNFETVWSAKKDAFGSPSIERGCLVKTPEGRWRIRLPTPSISATVLSSAGHATFGLRLDTVGTRCAVRSEQLFDERQAHADEGLEHAMYQLLRQALPRRRWPRAWAPSACRSATRVG